MGTFSTKLKRTLHSHRILPFVSYVTNRLIRILGIFVLLTISLSLGCSSQRIQTDLDAEDRYLLAKRLLDKGDCLKAVEEFQKVIFNFPGSDFVDDAEYGLGEAHYCAKEYALAASQFRRILRDYPLSPFADDAQYMLGACYFEQSMSSSLDQEFTHKAIEAFEKLIEDFPESDRMNETGEKLTHCKNKLAKKDYEVGRLYLRLGYFQAAIFYFEEVLTRYPASKWAAEAQYGIGQVHEKQKKYDEALAAYQKVVIHYSTVATVSENARKRIKEIKEKTRNKEGID